MKKEFLLYGAVSVVALAVDVLLLYFAVVSLGMPAVLAAALAYAAGLVVHYVLSVRYVFTFRRMAGCGEAMVYALTGVMGILLSAGVVHIGGLLGQSLPVSKLVAVLPSFASVFIIRKMTLFSATMDEWKRAQ